MKKIICDRCGRDITDKWDILEIHRFNQANMPSHIQYEICDGCAKFIIDHVNERRNNNDESIRFI